MKKVLVSILALAMMLSCFCTINVFATEATPTITAKNAAGEVVGTYTSISSAASAAGENGTVVLSEGTFEFNGRQGISVNGITLEGAGKDLTSIVPSSTFKDGSDTNRKALLTIAANNVTVKDLTIDGSVFGSTIDPSEEDFIVLRCNSGSNVNLNNILVTGSQKSLIQVGTSSNSSNVTGTNLYCEAYYKAIPASIGDIYGDVFADVEIATNSSLTLNSGAVNGFIHVNNRATLTNNTTNHYHLTKRVLFLKTVDVTTTVKHFVNSYASVRGTASAYEQSQFCDTVYQNVSLVRTMTNEAVLSTDREMIQNFIVLLTDVVDEHPDATLSQCILDLQAALDALPVNN